MPSEKQPINPEYTDVLEQIRQAADARFGQPVDNPMQTTMQQLMPMMEQSAKRRRWFNMFGMQDPEAPMFNQFMQMQMFNAQQQQTQQTVRQKFMLDAQKTLLDSIYQREILSLREKEADARIAAQTADEELARSRDSRERAAAERAAELHKENMVRLETERLLLEFKYENQEKQFNQEIKESNARIGSSEAAQRASDAAVKSHLTQADTNIQEAKLLAEKVKEAQRGNNTAEEQEAIDAELVKDIETFAPEYKGQGQDILDQSKANNQSWAATIKDWKSKEKYGVDRAGRTAMSTTIDSNLQFEPTKDGNVQMSPGSYSALQDLGVSPSPIAVAPTFAPGAEPPPEIVQPTLMQWLTSQASPDGLNSFEGPEDLLPAMGDLEKSIYAEDAALRGAAMASQVRL
jgi:hypothetical protein